MRTRITRFSWPCITMIALAAMPASLFAGWELEAELLDLYGQDGDCAGIRVALSGDWAITCTPYDDYD